MPGRLPLLPRARRTVMAVGAEAWKLCAPVRIQVFVLCTQIARFAGVERHAGTVTSNGSFPESSLRVRRQQSRGCDPPAVGATGLMKSSVGRKSTHAMAS